MAQYVPKTWTTGETITAAELNALEQAAAAAITSADTVSADKVADGTTNKAYTAAEKTKLAGVAPSATANSTDAQLRDRSTHTGTQAATTITGLSTVATSGAYSDLSGKPTIPPALPTQTGNAGKYLTTDGTTPSWVAATSGTTVTDNGDGTFTASGSGVTDNGDGTLTIG